MINSVLTKKNLLLLLSKMLGENYNNPININNENFIGFFQWNNTKNDTLTYHQKCTLAIDYFKNCFERYFGSVIIATSLIVDNNILKKNQLEHLLALKGFILPLNFKLIFSDDDINYREGLDYDDIDHVYNELIASFRFFTKYNSNDIINLSYICMESDILRSNSGYLFFIIPELNIVIYPHDDIGFGCLCIEVNESKSIAKDFIKGIANDNPNWSSNIKKG